MKIVHSYKDNHQRKARMDFEL